MQTLWSNASVIAIVFLFIGFVVSALTSSGKEDALVSEKVHDARDALEDKVVAAMDRYVTEELESVKQLIGSARANALEDNVRVYRVVKGDRHQIAGVSLAIPSDTWQVLGLRAEGDKFTVTLNGKEVFAATDGTFTEPGRVALWTKADSVTHFDQMTIVPLQ